MNPPEAVTTAVVAAGDEETRVLLRGLLRLHHFQILGEADGSSRAMELIRDHRPNVVVADVNLAEGSFATLVADARLAHPAVRIVLVAPASRPQPAAVGPSVPDAILYRPFRIRQFSEAVRPPGSAPTPTRADAGPS
jgi:DNA-binding NarL/FixJ family response regulator